MKLLRAGIGTLVASMCVAVLGPGCDRVTSSGEPAAAREPAIVRPPLVVLDASPVDLGADAAVDAAAAADTNLTAWSDPGVLDLLARDCAWKPAYVHGDQSPLSCGYDIPEQSCGHGHCSNVEYDCEQGCETTCETCAQSCAGSCGSCEARCTDDACRRACAVTTASCRKACSTGKDRCLTAGCQVRVKACTDTHDARWTANGCWERCDKLRPCIGQCEDYSEKDDGAAYKACSAKCTARFKGGCPADFEEFCEHPS